MGARHGLTAAAAELLLVTHSGRRLHRVPVSALTSVGFSCSGRATVAATALPSGQVVHVSAAEIRPFAVPDDDVSAVLTRFSVTGLRPAADPGRPGLPLFGNLVDPTWLSLSLGGQCDSACVFCFTEWIRHEPALTTEQARRALDEAAAIASVGSVVFTGGEPTLRADLPGLVRHAVARGFTTVGVQSNGHRLANDGYRDGLLDAGVSRVLLSLHGARPETHDGIARHRNSFARALRALASLAADDRVAVEANFVVCPQNTDETEDFVELVRRTAPGASVRFSLPIVEGAAHDNEESTLPDVRTFVTRVSAAVRAAAGTIPVSVANTPPCVSAAIGVPPAYTLSQRRSMLWVSPFVSAATPRGEVAAKLEACTGCRFATDCDGFQLPYLRQFPGSCRAIAREHAAGPLTAG